jgi:hypothetical protein
VPGVGTTVIFCTDPLNPRQAEPHFAGEAKAARELGLPVARLDHDALLAGDLATAVARVPRGAGPAWYRGWMIPAPRWAELAQALAAREVELLTSPEAYRRAHELPNWYGTFEAVTPRSVWTAAAPGKPPGAAALARLTAPLGGGQGVVKDFVKSRKHEWHEACHVPDLADTARLAAVVARLFELQGDSLAGGVVVRAFERFTGDEVRVWWVGAEPVTATAHPDSPGRPAASPGPVLASLRPLVAALGCPFVTTDLALREDGTWRIVEVGDGQVSDLPPGTDPTPLLEALSLAGLSAAEASL